MTHAKSVAIIGAGASGLVAAKVLSEDGFNVTLFDRHRQLGGIWSEESAYANLHTQQSGGTMDFADLFDGEEYASWEHTHDYLQKYADKFNITERIQLNTRVVSIYKCDLKKETLPWLVKVEMEDGQCETLEFDLLVIATGLFSEPNMPNFYGQEKFGGSIVHTHAIKSSEQLINKRIAVIGGGKSATDMAVLAGSFGQLCYMIFRRAHWMTPRALLGGLLPLRLFYTRVLCVPLSPFPGAPHSALFHFLHRIFSPFLTLIMQGLTNNMVATLGSDLFNDKIFLPQYPYRNAETMSVIPDDFIRLKREGRIIGKLASINQIVNENTIQLDSGEEIQVDMIINATGSIEHFPFFSDKDAQIMGVPSRVLSETQFNLYRRIIPVQVPNIAFVGFTACVANWMVSEVASHWISDYFLGRIKLPASEKEMHDEIMTMHRFTRQMFKRHACFINYYWLDPIEIYLNDMGLSLHRTNNWISEYFGIYRPKRLKGLHEERKVKAEGRRTKWHFYFGFGHTLFTVFILILVYIFFFV